MPVAATPDSNVLFKDLTLRVNGARLMDSIHTSCEFGKAHAYGE